MLLQPSHSIVNMLIKHVVNPYQAVLPQQPESFHFFNDHSEPVCLFKFTAMNQHPHLFTNHINALISRIKSTLQTEEDFHCRCSMNNGIGIDGHRCLWPLQMVRCMGSWGQDAGMWRQVEERPRKQGYREIPASWNNRGHVWARKENSQGRKMETEQPSPVYLHSTTFTGTTHTDCI